MNEAAGAAGPRRQRAVKISVLTGFLGVGKTTWLNAALRDPALSGTAVIVNEFGEIGLDHLLVEAVSGDMLVLTTGCICCAARGDLLAALDTLLQRRREGSIAFDRVVIETTGVADPGPVLNALLLGPALSGEARIGDVVTLVSATDGLATLDRHDEARRQVALADRILLTKTDLVAAGDPMARLGARLLDLNPLAGVARAGEPGFGPAVLLGTGDARPAPLPAPDHHHHGSAAQIRSVILEAGVVEPRRLLRAIKLLQARSGPALLRLKGVAALADDPARPAVIQAVGHLVHPVTRLDAWPAGDRRTRLVAILDGVDPSDAASLWDDALGPPRIDRPDAAGLLASAASGPSLFD